MNEKLVVTQSERDAFWSITGFALFVAMLAAIWF